MLESKGNWTPEETGRIREQLQRLLQSELFDHSDRHSRFLRYVVEETLAGRADRLNGFLVGVEVFDRDESFDPAVDSIVRVEAGRLRAKLREYYTGPGLTDPVEIQLPKGGYAVRFTKREAERTLTAVQTDAAVSASGAYGPPPMDEAPTVAVLPFDNLSTDPEQEYFSDGITEDIITDLSRLSGLHVISRHSTFVYKGRAVSTREISEELGARYIIEGSVRKAGDRIRISAQLIDVMTDSHLWAQRFDRELHDVFTIQAGVSRKIVDALKVKLTAQEEARLGHKGTENIEAHDYLLRALEQYYLFTADAVDNAIAYLAKAIELDPNYAEAYAWQSRITTYNFTMSKNPSLEETVIPAIALARRAIELDELLPMGHANLGWALMWYKEIDEALEEVQRAVDLDPNYADALLRQSMVLSSAGKGQEALASIDKAISLDPHYVITYTFALGLAYYVLGQYDKALQHFERGIQRNPQFLPNHFLKTSVLGLMENRQEEARAACKRLRELHPEYASTYTSIFNDQALTERLLEGLHRAGFQPSTGK
jgi:adenylate cyclase